MVLDAAQMMNAHISSHTHTHTSVGSPALLKFAKTWTCSFTNSVCVCVCVRVCVSTASVRTNSIAECFVSCYLQHWNATPNKETFYGLVDLSIGEI